MQNNILKGRICIMSMGAPAARPQIHFYVARPGAAIANLYHRPSKIRPAFDTSKTRMKNSDGLAVQGLELFTQQALVLPDGLEQALGRGFVVLAQEWGDAATGAPLGIEIG